MATATVNQGKTSFVKQFLNDHPEGNTKAVNEAWKAAGFDGTISPTLVNKTRVKLTGKRRRRARTAAKGKAAATKPREAPATRGKTSFVKEFLNDNSQGNVKAVNEAWTKAGMSGTISPTLVNKMKSATGADRQSAREVEDRGIRQGNDDRKETRETAEGGHHCG